MSTCQLNSSIPHFLISRDPNKQDTVTLNDWGNNVRAISVHESNSRVYSLAIHMKDNTSYRLMLKTNSAFVTLHSESSVSRLQKLTAGDRIPFTDKKVVLSQKVKQLPALSSGAFN